LAARRPIIAISTSLPPFSTTPPRRSRVVRMPSAPLLGVWPAQPRRGCCPGQRLFAKTAILRVLLLVPRFGRLRVVSSRGPDRHAASRGLADEDGPLPCH